MSDYTKTTDFVAKDAAEATIQGSLWDTEYDNIQTAIATKVDKVLSPVNGNLIYTDGSSIYKDVGSSPTQLFPTKVQATISGVNKYTLALSGTVEAVDVAFRNVQGTDDDNELRFRIGSLGTILTSGYKFAGTMAGYSTYSMSYDGWRFSWLPASLPAPYSQNSNGNISIRRVYGNIWVYEARTYDHYDDPSTGNPRASYYGGLVTLSNPLDIIGFGDNTYGTIRNGNINVTYWRSA